MNTHTRFTVLFTCGLLLILSGQAMADTQEQVNTFIEAWQRVIQTQDMEAAIALAHPDVPKSEIDANKGILLEHFSEYASANPQITMHDSTQYQNYTVVQATLTLNPTDQPTSERHMLYGLKAHGKRLMLWSYAEQAGPDMFNPHTRLVTSKKGQFTLTVPQNWYAAKPMGPLKAISAGSAILLGPDMNSTFAMGVVQLPMKIADTDLETAKVAVQADVAAEKRMTGVHQLVNQGPAVFGGKDAYMVQTQFKLEASDTLTYHRTRYYIHHDPMIYFFLCDTYDSSNAETMTQDFDAIMHSFKLLPQEEGISLQETMAAQQGEGSVTGTVYTSEAFNCFIAAPQGWTLRTSPNPAHLVEMQYKEGKSIARLIGQKGLPDTLSLKNLVDGHAKSLKKITEAYESLST
ncbi:MAG: hypothetical protein HQ515_17610, partial [Phycisphaeraceae bacterium]|nr:hypothetical protein [Phycisphaeraceae bacterium]